MAILTLLHSDLIPKPSNALSSMLSRLTQLLSVGQLPSCISMSHDADTKSLESGDPENMFIVIGIASLPSLKCEI
jgi:hypothetical protein